MNKLNKKTTILIFSGSILGIVIILLIVATLLKPKQEDKYETVNLRELNYGFLNMDTPFYYYNREDYKTIIGADLSEFNKNVDFQKLKDQGIEFIFIRLGWRGYLEPILHLDDKFEEYYKQAKELDIKLGVYFFSQAISEDEAIEEANFVIDTLKDKEINFYVAYDLESIEDSRARTNSLSKEERSNNAIAFAETIKENGYEPIIYANFDWMNNYYDSRVKENYPIWFAQYNYMPRYNGEFIIWQYGSGFLIDGVSLNGVDLNMMVERKEETN